MRLRDGKSLPSYHCEKEFHQYDLTKTPTTLWKRGTGIDFCGSGFPSLSGTVMFPAVSLLNPQGDGAKFLDFSKRAEDGPSRADGLSKTFPEEPGQSSGT